MDYAVVGAGFSGMLLAYLLEKKGLKVTLYEKEEFLGGHCKTISNKNVFFEMGNVFCFSKDIKTLLIELDIKYTEKFTYRNFLDENFAKVEHISREDVNSLLDEFKRLEIILKPYINELNNINYNYINKDFMTSLYDFLKYHKLDTIIEVLAPHISSFGFGSIHEISPYYAFNIFSIDTINSFIKGDKLLFIENGMSEIIEKLKQNISDIRYSSTVKSIESIDNKIKISTNFEESLYDKVIITAKLMDNVIKDETSNNMMKKIETNPYITCSFETPEKNIVTTYYKSNLGKMEKIQFFHTFKKNNRTILVAYAYGYLNDDLIKNIREDIEKSGISITNLITAKQWHIFPHLKLKNLDSNFYIDILNYQKSSNIYFSGSLISKPALSNLYLSLRDFANHEKY